MPAIWVPRDFATKAKDYAKKFKQPVPKIYILSAAHRGDMYHIRAALFTNPLPLVLHSCPNTATNDLIEYVTVLPKEWSVPFFTTQMTMTQIQGAQSPAAGLEKVEFVLVREAASTREFKTNISQHDFKHSMAITTDYRQMIYKEFQKPAINPFATIGLPDNKTRHVLVLHRGTGCTGDSGVYPELDTGAALSQLVSMINAQKDVTGKLSLKAIVAGGPAGPNSIGQYWNKLDPVVTAFKRHNITKRDIEADFLLWAHDQGYFSMAVGFRSGALDLLTFMGIETLSIGLRNMGGEERHGLLVEQSLKRINVQYDHPRHGATEWVKSDADAIKAVLDSPGWKRPAPFGMNRPDKSAEDKAEIKTTPPGRFNDVDAWTVEVALRTAAGRFLKGWGQTVSSVRYEIQKQVPIDHDIVTVRDSRFAYKSEDRNNAQAREAHFKALKAADVAAMNRLASPAYKAQTLLPDVRKQEYTAESTADWEAAGPLISRTIGKKF